MAGDLQDILPLIGYMDETYARMFLMEQCVPPNTSIDDVTRIIREAQAATRRGEPVAPDPKILDFPPEMEETLSKIKGDQRLARLVKNRRWSLCQVEIDKLIPFQKYLNATYSDSISKGLDLEDLGVRIRFCLADEFLPRRSDMLEVQKANLFVIEAEGTDLRVVDSKKSLDPSTRNATVTFTIGWGQPFVQVARLNGRYILKNGYHRAFALRSRGIEYIPCVLLDVNGYADLECSGPLSFSERSILGSQPPRFSSFFDKEIAPRVKTRSVSTIVVIKPDVRLIEAQPDASSSEQEKGLVPGPGTGELEYVDVRTIREDWNVYALGDGTLLKLRAVVTRAKRPGQESTSIEPDASQVISVCNPAKARRGPPSQGTPSAEELNASIVRRNIEFKTIREPINEYAAEGGHRILLHLRLLSVSSTSKYDEHGDPMYVLNTRPDLMEP
jgi:hypothetical protein